MMSISTGTTKKLQTASGSFSYSVSPIPDLVVVAILLMVTNLVHQQVKELTTQIGLNQLQKILDGLAQLASPPESNKDWILGLTAINYEDIPQNIEKVSADGFSQYIIGVGGATSLISAYELIERSCCQNFSIRTI